jgi:hypothetical protein
MLYTKDETRTTAVDEMITEQSMTSRKKPVDARLRLVAYIYAGLAEFPWKSFAMLTADSRHSFSLVGEMVQSRLPAGYA